ncbi:hypothetical protein V8F06_000615 [Rhypophila decipiens]
MQRAITTCRLSVGVRRERGAVYLTVKVHAVCMHLLVTAGYELVERHAPHGDSFDIARVTILYPSVARVSFFAAQFILSHLSSSETTVCSKVRITMFRTRRFSRFNSYSPFNIRKGQAKTFLTDGGEASD